MNVSQLNNRIKNVLRELGLKIYGPVAYKVDKTVVIVIPWKGSNFYEPRRYPFQKMKDTLRGYLRSIGIPEKAVERLHHKVPRGNVEFVFRTQLDMAVVEKIALEYHGPDGADSANVIGTEHKAAA